MADSHHSYAKPHFNRDLHSPIELKAPKSVGQATSSNFFTSFFCKFLFFALFIIAIPLFPSQAPDFINQGIVTKFWELVHLLFIGVAVSYGLFCRRNVEMDVETHSSSSTTDDSQSFVSSVLRASSIFEDAYDNSCGYGGNNAYQTFYSEKYKTESMVDLTSGSSVVRENSQPGSLNCEIGFENPWGYTENNVSQAWNSQYFRGDSQVVVAQTKDALNEYGESGLVMGHRQLGLPVRSLRSRVRNHDSGEVCNGTDESSFILKDSSNRPSNESSMVNKPFGDVSPMNLEDSFKETSELPRSGRMEIRKNVGIGTRSSHLRPHSVDETQFEALKSQSFWSSASFSSQTSSVVSDSPNCLSPSHTDASEVENLNMEELGKGKSFRNSYPPVSAPVAKKASFNAFHIRRYANGSLFEKNAQKSSEGDSKDKNESKKEDHPLDCQEWRSGSLKLNENPVKASSRGKSVRTIRGSKRAAEVMNLGERFEKHINGKVEKANDQVEAVYKRINEMKTRGSDHQSAGARKQDPMPKPTVSKLKKRKNKEYPEYFAVESKEELEREAEIVQENLDEEEAVSDSIDPGPNSNEVDKKASEFIAKFREQIRLQKVASVDRSRGSKLSGNNFR